MIPIDPSLTAYFSEKKLPKSPIDSSRRALSRSANHGCVHTRPVSAPPFYNAELDNRSQRVREVFKGFICKLIDKKFHQVGKKLLVVEPLDAKKTERTSLGIHSFRKLLNRNRGLEPIASQRVVEGLSALKQTNTQEEFAQLLLSNGWSEASVEEFDGVIERFVKIRAEESGTYFSSIMDQQRGHSIARFNRFVEIHMSFANRVIEHIPQIFQRKRYHALKKAFSAYKEQQLKIFSSDVVYKKPLTPEQKDEKSRAKAYRGAAMVKHARKDLTVYPERYGAGKSVCEEARCKVRRKVKPLDFILNTGAFSPEGLVYHFVELQEAHVFPAVKVFSEFSYYFAEALNIDQKVTVDYKNYVIANITQQALSSGDWMRRLSEHIKHINEGKKTDNEAYAKLFILFETVALLEGSQTNHMPAFYNQKTDHLSESKAKSVETKTLTDPIALRIVKKLHDVFEGGVRVHQMDVIEIYKEYFDSIKKACKEYLEKQAKVIPASTQSGIKHALGMVGAFDHLQAVYRTEQLYAKLAEDVVDFPHENLFDIMYEWVGKAAEANKITLD